MTTSGVAVASLILALLTLGMLTGLTVLSFHPKQSSPQKPIPPPPAPAPPSPPAPGPPAPPGPGPPPAPSPDTTLDPEHIYLPAAHFELQKGKTPGNKLKQNAYWIMPIGTFQPHHTVTYFANDDSTLGTNYAKLDIQSGSGKDRAKFLLIVVEGVLKVDVNQLYSALPERVVLKQCAECCYKATRDQNASLSPKNTPISSTPGVVYTVALVALFEPGSATDDAVTVDSFETHIISQTQPQDGLSTGSCAQIA